MNDIQKDWIIFLGVIPDLHDEAVAVVREWREYARANGVDRDGLTGLNGQLARRVGMRLTGHSCCLSYGSLRIDRYGAVVADFIDDGGLRSLPELFEKAGRSIDYGDRDYMLVNQSVAFLWYTEYFCILGFTLDGHIVIDTKEMYGSANGQSEYRRAVGDREYCCRLLETVRKNYAKALLPEVPKGILKLPDRL